MRYILLNKPRGFVSTLYDPEGRRTVLDLIRRRDCPERIYPVGRLDYDTTGLLLLTNDGDLARKLSHPSNEVEKFYHAELDRPLLPADLDSIRRGVLLDDGIAEIDDIHVLEEAPTNVGVAIHMGRNRVIRRIFNRLGYIVNSLDRVGYAHLTKQNVPRRKWIFLSDKDVRKLKELVNKE